MIPVSKVSTMQIRIDCSVLFIWIIAVADCRQTKSRTNDWAAPAFPIRRHAALATVVSQQASAPAAYCRSTRRGKQSGLSCAVPIRLESERIRKRERERFSSAHLIEREIQLQNIHAGIAEDTEISPIGVLLDELANFVFAQSASFGDTRDLQLGITQTDLWIESATGRGNCICRNRLGFTQAIFRAIGGDPFFDRVVQFLRSWPQIAATRTASIVAVACGRGSRVKIFRVRERLAQQFRAADAPVCTGNQAAVGLVAKQQLRNSEHDERIQTAADHCQDER